MPLSHADPAATPGGAPRGDARPVRRRRINFACNYCRNRKTRCDEQKPSCTACTAAGVECITTDRRRPGVEVSRRETQHRASRASTSASLPTPASSRLYSSPPSRHDRASADGPAGAETGSPAGASFSADGGAGHSPGYAALSSTTASTRSAWPGEDALPAGSGHTKFQGKLPVFLPCRGANSVEIIADWLDLASRRLGLHRRCGLPSSPGRHPTRQLLARGLPSEPCQFPPADTSRRLAASFFNGINLLFPLVSRARFDENISTALDLGPHALAESMPISALAQMYTIWAIGYAAEPRFDGVFDPWRCLNYCKSLLGHLAVLNSVENVRAIVLFAICLNIYDDCAGACNTLNIGVSMAVTMGLHQPCSSRHRVAHGRPDAVSGDDDVTSLWLGIYAYEKLLSFELTRPSLIRDEDCHPLPPHDLATNNNCETPFETEAFRVILGLAKTLGEIGRKSVIVSRKEEDFSGHRLQALIAEKVQTVAESVILLTRWVEAVPEELRPTSDIMMGSATCPIASYIAMQYNNALLVLDRNSLLISKEALSAGASVIAKGKPWDYVLRNGQSITANAARKILKILVEILDSQSALLFSSWMSVFNAFATLAVHIITHPESRVSVMDFHLMQAAADLVKGVGSRTRDDELLNFLLQKVDAILAQQATPPPAFLGLYASPELIPTNTTTQDAPRATQARSSANKPEHAGRSLSSGDAVYNTPGAELLNINSIISSNDDFGYDALYSAISILGDEWFPSMPDGMGILSAGSLL